MGNPVSWAIWYLRTECDIYISRKLERYIIEELEDELFPYAFGTGSEDDVLKDVLECVRRVNAKEINIFKPIEERILDRYEALKEEHLDLLYKMNRMRMGTISEEDEWHDDLPF